MKVYVLINYYKSAPFFCSLAKSDNRRSYLFICTSPVAYLYIKRQGFDCLFFNSVLSKRVGAYTESDLFNAIEYRASYVSPRRCINYCNGLYYYLSNLVKGDEDEIYFLTWNGDNLNGVVMRDLAKNNVKIKTGFFEISNLPGKIVVDGKGVNKCSSLYERPDLLDKFDFKFDENFLSNYRSEYLVFKKNYKVKNNFSWSAGLRLMELIYFCSFGVRYFKFPSAIKKTKINKSLLSSCGAESFCLYPLQVRSDTQVIINSDISLRGGLLEIIRDTKLPIIITPHPYDIGALSEISDIIEDNERISVSREGTFNLIGQAQKIYVLNSTLGLEAKIIGKPVKFLGNSFFDKLTDQQIDKYIHCYLVDGDFLSGEMVSQETVEIIYKTINMTYSS